MATTDNVQIRVDIFTDESKQMAKTIKDTQEFKKELNSAQSEVAKLNKEMAKLSAAGEDTTETQKKLAAAELKVNTALQNIVNTGQQLSKVDLSKLLPSQLETRAKQLKDAMQNITIDSGERKKMAAELELINIELGRVKVSAKATSDEMNAMRSVTNTIYAIGTAFFGLRSIVSNVFKASDLSSQMEQATIAFETMLGSESKARKLVGEIQKLAANTPFETKELTDYAKQLIAMGIEGDKVIATMTHLGDIAAGVGRDKLPQLVLAYGEVSTATKLSGKELRQFNQAGVPLIEELAKQFGVAKEEISKMAREGEIKFKDVEKAIESLTTEGGKFAGLMQKQSLTTQGLLSTLKDNIDLLFVSFGDGFNIAFKEMLKSLINFTNGLDREKVKAFGESVGNLVKFLFDFGPALLRIVSIYVAYNAGLATYKVAMTAVIALQWLGIIPINAETKAKLALAAATKVATSAEEKLAEAAKKTQAAFGLWVAGITLAIEVAIALYDKMTALSAGQQAIKDATEEATTAIKGEIQTSTNLFAILKDVSTSYEQKHAAVQKIMQQYPDYLGDIKTEKDLLANLEVAQQRVNEKIIEEGLARVKANKIQEFANELLETNLAIAKERSKPGGLLVNEDGTSEVVNTSLDGLLQKQQQILNKTKEFTSTFEGTAREVSKSIATMIQSNTSALSEEIDAAYKELQAASDRDDEAGQEATLKRINQLEAQKDKIISETVDLGEKKKEIEAKNEEDSDKARKEHLKRVKDAMDAELKESEIYFKREQLVAEVAFLQKRITESQYNKFELELQKNKYRDMLDIYENYKHAFGEKSKEATDIELKQLEEQKKLIETTAKLAPKNTRVTESIATLKSGEIPSVKQDDKDLQLQKLHETSEAETKMIQQKFAQQVFNEIQFENEIARIKKEGADKAYDIALKAAEQETKLGKELSDKEKAELAKLLTAKTDANNHYNDITLKNEKRTGDLKFQLEQLKLKKSSEALGIGIELLSSDAEARKKNASAIKALEIGQVTVQGVTEVQAIWEHSNMNLLNAAIPGFGAVLAGVETGFAVARTGAAINKIAATQYAEGGYTGLGGLKDSSGFGVKGVVHEGEYVVPKHIVDNPKFASVLSVLENSRLKRQGFATGGFVNTTPSYTDFSGITAVSANFNTSGIENKLDAFTKSIENWQSNFEVHLPLIKLERAQKRVELDRANASF